jgi:predicted RND superfamily exporter protein
VTINAVRSKRLVRLYDSVVLRRPLATLIVVALLVASLGYFAPRMELAASADSLMLQDDQELDYNRTLRARYGSDDFLIVTYTPESDLFSDPVLERIGQLRDELRAVEGVSEVVSLLDVPLLQSPPIDLDDLPDGVNLLSDPAVDRELARRELTESPLYRNLMVGSDGRTTALRVDLQAEDAYQRLFRDRQILLDKRKETPWTDEERAEFKRIDAAFEQNVRLLSEQQTRVIRDVRAIMDRYRDDAQLYLGGVPMIITDSIDFIRHDLVVFGTGVVVFIIVLLAVAFRRLRWVVLSLGTCFAAGLAMVGFLGLVEWPVTVVSSNFISLLLILTLSLTLHLIVRYRELHLKDPGAQQFELVRETLRSKAMPSLYAVLTTMVAFGSLLISRIGPVIDFGWMMIAGLTLGLILAFTIFPAGLMLLKPVPVRTYVDPIEHATTWLAGLVRSRGAAIITLCVALAFVSVLGTTRLTVENRFIDYFRKSTEIYKGMSLIDRELGGTTPLDIVIDAPPREDEEEEIDPDDPFAKEMAEIMAEETGIATSSHWFNSRGLKQIRGIQAGLERFPETGKVMSLGTASEIFGQLAPQTLDNDFVLSVLYRKLPDEARKVLIDPYFSESQDQLHFQIRVFESDPSLRRGELLKKIHKYLVNDQELPDDMVRLSGVLVLYHNVLQTLFQSQITTLGTVFVVIFLMFAILFRSMRVAVVAIIPNMLSAALVLGLMGWLNIHLDLMTVTIAAITIGIAVDNTLHYVYRFRSELARDNDYLAAVRRSHRSVGRAMVYTTVTITLGFSILALSEFVPTIYFGLLTGFAMMVALVANLTLLPVLLALAKVSATPHVIRDEAFEQM